LGLTSGLISSISQILRGVPVPQTSGSELASELNTEPGSVIRARRKALGITQAELADLSGISVRTIVEIESGGNSISLKRLLPVLATLGLRLSIAVARNG
jgi:y4mF family transcriptional regulator